MTNLLRTPDPRLPVLAPPRSQATRYLQRVTRVNKQVEEYLTEGTLVEDYVLDNIGRLMSCIRECNVTLRWNMLHTAAGVCVCLCPD